ncbi:hypothetical protein BKG61_02980 [Mycobacterium syngnathidarum]|uniref:HEAT repeat domain-containing protein n=1 Tax=Mycobacterium syngnathidarum TaxID=1908205 RepID=A0A1S1KLK7_9MYCO|nr:hypothetical protein BKG61_02980 [Mycobacterium syngnathidarum]
MVRAVTVHLLSFRRVGDGQAYRVASTDTDHPARRGPPEAAVPSLSRWANSEATARQALTVALEDSDADVRAYARQALAG